MSTYLKTTPCLTGGVTLTRYSGGVANGVCVQLLFKKPECEDDQPDYGYWYMQLTREQAREMAESLLDFAKGA